MKYLTGIHQSATEPKELEALYQAAREAGEAEDFSSDLFACYQESPDNLLLAAWYYRLQAAPAEQVSRPERSTIWRWAVPLALLSGLAVGLIFVTGTGRQRERCIRWQGRAVEYPQAGQISACSADRFGKPAIPTRVEADKIPRVF